MAMNVNGCTTCNTKGEEKYEEYEIKLGLRTISRVQYDYRDMDGELFSCVAITLEDCRAKRDAWLNNKTTRQ